MWQEIPQKTGPAAWSSTGWLFRDQMVSFCLHVSTELQQQLNRITGMLF